MTDQQHAITELALVLSAAFVGGNIFKKFKQPVLVGYIIVGIILGPSVLGLVENAGDISLLAELGTLLLLFIVGMEMDLSSFRSIAKTSIVTCAVQITCGLGAMFALGWVFDWPISRTVLLGFAVALSSTAVALKILEDMGLRDSKVGRSSVGILIAQDIAIIPMILIVGAMNGEGGFDYLGIVRLFIAVGLLGGLMYLLMKKPSFFQETWARFEAWSHHAMVGQTAITALSLCFVSAAIAGIFGLSPAYGAFLAGIALGHTASQHQLEEQTKPIFDVLIMVFFLSIGLLIDLKFLAEHLTMTVSFLLVTMALKTVVNFGVLRWLGMNVKEAFVTAAVLAQVGEFAFILAALGLNSGAIGDIGYKYIVAVISLSLLITPFWIYLINRLQILRTLRRKQRIKKAVQQQNS